MNQIIVLAGPTAVGKTKFSIAIAKAIQGEIVSCDSMQLYKYMNIGSAKPTEEELKTVPHHLVDQIDPQQPFSVAEYCHLAKKSISEIFQHGNIPIVEGGTGLYLNSLLFDMDFSNAPQDIELRKQLEKEAELYGNEFLYRKLQSYDLEVSQRIHPNNVKKIIRALEGAISGHSIQDFQECKQKTKDYDSVLIGLTRDREELYKRINQRVDQMMEAGLLEEVQELLNRGLCVEDISMKGIGYKEIIGYFNGEYDKEYAIEQIKKNTRHLAKRQLTWFRRYEDMKWFNLSEYANDDEAIEDVLQWLKKK